MRLLEDRGHGNLSLVEYFDNIPRYAILSHTWGSDGDEVTFKDFVKGTGKERAGYNKIEFCRKQTVSDGLQHFWVDTCCIDKSSSAELTEAINSMFRWYQDASNCYVYLPDVSTSRERTSTQSSSTTWEAAFRKSRWFTRGWTLQELIAPTSVEFFSREGDRLGSKKSLEQEIHEVTKITIDALRGVPLTEFKVEERFSWADHRETKRQEDKAYSLLGIFNVHMPLIYGEGNKSFVRLREAINRTSLIQEQKRQQHRTITNWVSSVDFAAQQSDIISRKQEGTGVWFINSPEFLDWLQSSNQTLFCPGIPGAGKTMIAAITVNHLWQHMRDRDIGVAYIYYNYKTQVDQKVINLAAIILKQLTQERLSIAEPVINLYDRYADRGIRPPLEEILSALQAVVSSYSKVYVVVDALDECLNHDRTQLLAMLRNLQSKGNLNVMATSRFIPEVEQYFTSSLLLAVRADESDVKRFVAGQMYRLPRYVQRDNQLQETIQDRICTAVEGMFLLARLYLDSLLDKNSKKKILSTLAELPRGSEALDEAYNDAIKRIEGQLSGHRTLAMNVLSWIIYAQRPLTTGELCHALAVESGETELDLDNIPDVEDMVSVCAGLVTIDNESNTIRLVHYTTQEYFERIRESWNPRAQQEIASACLTYLSFDPFRSGSCSNNEEFKSRLEKNVLLDYASRYWGQHARTVQEQVYHVGSRFLQNIPLVCCAIQAMSISEYKDVVFIQSSLKQATGLHLTARLGLLYLSARLLTETSRNNDIAADSKDDDGRTPLWWAIEGGHEAVVKLLLERDDVDVNSKGDYDGQTPLWCAAERGHEALVKLLLERDDVDVNLKAGYDGQTPLSSAAAAEQERVACRQRDGFNADWVGGYSETPLWAAAERGHEAVVKLLLERDDIDVNSKNSDGETPLSCAAAEGHETMVKLLLERHDVDVNVNSTGDYGRQMPLSCAAAAGHEMVVKLLLERHDVDVNVSSMGDFGGQTPLSCAAAAGNETMVKLLLERDDIDVNLKDEYGGQTPLSCAAAAGHETVVKLLLERDDVDVNLKDSGGQTPLSCAAAEGHETVVKLLLERDDVDVNAKAEYGGQTPLWHAAEGGHEAVVKLLLERDDVDVNSKDDCDGQTPLWRAAAAGHDVVVKLLLERDDVDVNSKDRDGQTPPLWLYRLNCE